MLKEIIEKKRYSFCDGFDTWEESVKAACKPLIEEGSIKPVYADAIIENVKKYGPYIVISPDVCVPHAESGAAGVNKTAVCFMRTKTPVYFNDNKDKGVRLFFVLASTDHKIHLENLANLAKLIENKSIVEKLIKSESKEDLNSIADELDL